jgi:hypothetical protein
MKPAMRDEYMNAVFDEVGRGAMQMAQVIQDIRKPGARLAAAMFFFKCVLDSNKLPQAELFASVARMEKEATRHQNAKLAGARAYIENDFLSHD